MRAAPPGTKGMPTASCSPCRLASARAGNSGRPATAANVRVAAHLGLSSDIVLGPLSTDGRHHSLDRRPPPLTALSHGFPRVRLFVGHRYALERIFVGLLIGFYFGLILGLLGVLLMFSSSSPSHFLGVDGYGHQRNRQSRYEDAHLQKSSKTPLSKLADRGRLWRN